MKLVPLDFSGGVNLIRDRRYVAPNELTYAKNFVPTKSGLAGKRLPRELVLKSDGTPVNLTFIPPLSLHVTDISGADLLITYRSVSLGLAAVSLYTVGGVLQAGASFDVMPTRRPQAVSFDRKIYVVAGIETLGRITWVVDGTTYVGTSGIILQSSSTGSPETVSLNFTGTQTIPVCPRLLASYRRRMVYADFGPGMEDWLIFSDFQAPTTISADVLAANGRNFRLGGTPGRITALREVMLTATGTPTETALVAFKEQSMYIIQGEPGQTTDTTPGSGPNTILGTLVVQRVNTNAGCSSPETIVQTPYGLLWAGPDDVWMLSSGQVPVRVGTKIRPILEATPADKRYLWHASYFNGFYRLSVFSEGQGPGEDSPCGEQWWLDLRDTDEDGQPNLRWWGPMVYKCVPGGDDTSTELTGVRMQALDTRDGKAPTLYSAEFNNDGQSFLHVYDTPGSGRDGALPTGFPSESSVNGADGSEIEVELRTAELDEGDPGTEKVYAGVELSLASSEAVQMSAETHFDGGQRVITNTEVFGQTGFVLDVNVLDSDTQFLTREFKPQTIRPSPSTRPRGYTLQQTIKDVPGYIIDDTCNQMCLLIDPVEAYGPGTKFFSFTLTSGYYATIAALVTEIAVQVEIATSVTDVLNWLSTMTSNQSPRSAATANFVLVPGGGYTIQAWGFLWANDAVTELDPVRGKLGAMLGFDVVNGSGGFGSWISASVTNTLTADTPIFNKRVAHFELNNIFHDIIPMFRRPL